MFKFYYVKVIFVELLLSQLKSVTEEEHVRMYERADTSNYLNRYFIISSRSTSFKSVFIPVCFCRSIKPVWLVVAGVMCDAAMAPGHGARTQDKLPGPGLLTNH